MNTDIRLAVSFRGHRKRKRLRLLLGPGSTDYLLDLWIATAMNHPDGILTGMDETDIALEAGWEGEPQAFVAALLECRLLEKSEHGYALHDWAEHQAYVVHAEDRKTQAKNAAAKRWAARTAPVMPTECAEHPTGNAASLASANSEPTTGNAHAKSGNAPSPSPIPSPSPVPNPAPDPSLLPSHAPAAGMSKRAPVGRSCEQEKEAARLAVLMRDTLMANLQTFAEPDLSAWEDTLHKALSEDARMQDAHFVAHVITWACAEPFWKGVIHNPARLQKNFSKIVQKMEAEQSDPRNRSPAERRVAQNMAAADEARAMLFGPKVVEGEEAKP